MSTPTTPQSHLAKVTQSFDASSDERLVTILRCAAKHLHAFVLETSLTREECAAGIDFLTLTTQRCDEERQEFILLSDTLGVSMLVEMVNQHPSDAATEPTALGPYYVAGAPAKALGDSIAAGDEGTPLTIYGVVAQPTASRSMGRGSRCGRPRRAASTTCRTLRSSR